MTGSHLSVTGVLSADRHRLELADDTPLTHFDLEQASQYLPSSVARENTCLALQKNGEVLHIACLDQNDVYLLDKLRFLLNCDVQAYTRPASEILNHIATVYMFPDESCDSLLQEFTDSAIDFTETDLVRAPKPSFSTREARSLGSISGYSAKPARLKKSLHATTKTNQGDRMFFYTVEEGQKVLMFRSGGNIELLQGPTRVWKGRSRFESMPHYVAHPGEYLRIQFINGTQQHMSGPCELWYDRRIHSSVQIQKGLPLAAKEAVVVYGADPKGVTQRRIVHGPGLFVPEPGEWLHTFSWHASRGGSRGAEKKPNNLKFEKLWLTPDQMYHDVRDVRTADDAVLIIRLMIFFELIDIEKMLDTTHDPIGDFINAATSDVVEFTGKRSFEQFKQQTEHLNELTTYSQLIHRANQCGYQINNVVYRGYGAPDSLQKMHDEAIAARTSLQLEKATERQTQELEDYRLQCQLDRSRERRNEQATEVQHEIELQNCRAVAKLEEQRQQKEFERNQKRLDSELESEIYKNNDVLKREHLGELAGMGVQLTEYLTQGRADQVIEVRGSNGNTPHVHLAERSKKPKAK